MRFNDLTKQKTHGICCNQVFDILKNLETKVEGRNTTAKEKVLINEKKKQLLREVSSENTSDWKQT